MGRTFRGIGHGRLDIVGSPSRSWLSCGCTSLLSPDMGSLWGVSGWGGGRIRSLVGRAEAAVSVKTPKWKCLPGSWIDTSGISWKGLSWRETFRRSPVNSRCLQPWELPGITRGWGWGGVGRRRGSETERQAAAQADSGHPGEEEEEPGAKRNRKHTAGSNAAERSRKSRMENCPLGVQPRGGHGRP